MFARPAGRMARGCAILSVTAAFGAFTAARSMTEVAPAPGGRWPDLTVAPLDVHARPPIDVHGRQRCVRAYPQPGAPAPHLVSTYPADGAVVRPGLLVLRITFDQPMGCDWLPTWRLTDNPPLCLHSSIMLLTPRRETFKILCRLRPSAFYAVHLNTGRNTSLRSVLGVPMGPAVFHFLTTSGPPVASVRAALTDDPHFAVEEAGQAAR